MCDGWILRVWLSLLRARVPIRLRLDHFNLSRYSGYSRTFSMTYVSIMYATCCRVVDLPPWWTVQRGTYPALLVGIWQHQRLGSFRRDYMYGWVLTRKIWRIVDNTDKYQHLRVLRIRNLKSIDTPMLLSYKWQSISRQDFLDKTLNPAVDCIYQKEGVF